MRFLIASLGFVLCLSPVAGGQDDRPPFKAAALVTASRPNAGHGPTEVKIAIFVVDIKRVIDVDQTVMADFFVQARWNDPRLARAGGSTEGKTRRLGMDELWHPAIQVINIARLFPQFPRRVLVDDSGQCVQLQRFIGSLSFPLDLRAFPFDALQQAPRHSTSTTVNRPSSLDSPSPQPVTSAAVWRKSSEPRSQHGVVRHIWTKFLPTVSRLNME